jgi:hypothetical protein
MQGLELGVLQSLGIKGLPQRLGQKQVTNLLLAMVTTRFSSACEMNLLQLMKLPVAQQLPQCSFLALLTAALEQRNRRVFQLITGMPVQAAGMEFKHVLAALQVAVEFALLCSAWHFLQYAQQNLTICGS